MEKQEFQQLTEEQQKVFIKKLVEERTKGSDSKIGFLLYKNEMEDGETCTSFSWEEPLGIFDECDLEYYKMNLEGLCESFLFNIIAYVNAENQAVLCINLFLYY